MGPRSRARCSSKPQRFQSAGGSHDFSGRTGYDIAVVRLLGDNQPPVATAGGPYAVTEGGALALDGSASSDSDANDTLTYAWDLDDDGVFGESGIDATRGDEIGVTPTFSAAGLDGPSTFQVALRVTDNHGDSSIDTADVTIDNAAAVVGAVTGSADPHAVNTSVSLSASFTDAGTGDTHSATWDWGDGTTSAGTVTESNGSGTVSDHHTYAAAGVYTVTFTVTDDDGASDESVFQYVVVYDPDAGFVAGGGTIDSPAGAYTADPTLAGPAQFAFVSKYQKGASVPTGQTRFQFKVGDFTFESTSYDWMVVSGAKAQYKGTGTVNGGGNYGFMISVVDGDRPGGGGVDKFRIKIWDKISGDIVYDNQLGDADDAEATTDIRGGNIRIQTR